MPSTMFERVGFLGWFAVDVGFVVIAMIHDGGSHRWSFNRIVLVNSLSLALLCAMCDIWTDKDATAYFTGFLIQLGISWGSVYDIYHNATIRGHSLEIW